MKLKQTQFSGIQIGVASPTQIKRWAEQYLPNNYIIGEIRNHQTLSYKTLEPVPGGLFCQRIFGPIRSFKCSCRNPKSQTDPLKKFCPQCLTKFTYCNVRRHRLGYIGLAFPVVHLWYLRGRINYISILLEREGRRKSKKKVKDITYCATTSSFFEPECGLLLGPLKPFFHLLPFPRMMIHREQPRKWNEEIVDRWDFSCFPKFCTNPPNSTDRLLEQYQKVITLPNSTTRTTTFLSHQRHLSLEQAHLLLPLTANPTAPINPTPNDQKPINLTNQENDWHLPCLLPSIPKQSADNLFPTDSYMARYLLRTGSNKTPLMQAALRSNIEVKKVELPTKSVVNLNKVETPLRYQYSTLPGICTHHRPVASLWSQIPLALPPRALLVNNGNVRICGTEIFSDKQVEWYLYTTQYRCPLSTLQILLNTKSLRLRDSQKREITPATRKKRILLLNRSNKHHNLFSTNNKVQDTLVRSKRWNWSAPSPLPLEYRLGKHVLNPLSATNQGKVFPFTFNDLCQTLGKARREDQPFDCRARKSQAAFGKAIYQSRFHTENTYCEIGLALVKEELLFIKYLGRWKKQIRCIGRFSVLPTVRKQYRRKVRKKRLQARIAQGVLTVEPFATIIRNKQLEQANNRFTSVDAIGFYKKTKVKGLSPNSTYKCRWGSSEAPLSSPPPKPWRVVPANVGLVGTNRQVIEGFSILKARMDSLKVRAICRIITSILLYKTQKRFGFITFSQAGDKIHERLEFSRKSGLDQFVETIGWLGNEQHASKPGKADLYQVANYLSTCFGNWLTTNQSSSYKRAVSRPQIRWQPLKVRYKKTLFAYNRLRNKKKKEIPLAAIQAMYGLRLCDAPKKEKETKKDRVKRFLGWLKLQPNKYEKYSCHSFKNPRFHLFINFPSDKHSIYSTSTKWSRCNEPRLAFSQVESLDSRPQVDLRLDPRLDPRLEQETVFKTTCFARTHTRVPYKSSSLSRKWLATSFIAGLARSKRNLQKVSFKWWASQKLNGSQKQIPTLYQPQPGVLLDLVKYPMKDPKVSVNWIKGFTKARVKQKKGGVLQQSSPSPEMRADIQRKWAGLASIDQLWYKQFLSLVQSNTLNEASLLEAKYNLRLAVEQANKETLSPVSFTPVKFVSSKRGLFKTRAGYPTTKQFEKIPCLVLEKPQYRSHLLLAGPLFQQVLFCAAKVDKESSALPDTSLVSSWSEAVGTLKSSDFYQLTTQFACRSYTQTHTRITITLGEFTVKDANFPRQKYVVFKPTSKHKYMTGRPRVLRFGTKGINSRRQLFRTTNRFTAQNPVILSPLRETQMTGGVAIKKELNSLNLKQIYKNFKVEQLSKLNFQIANVENRDWLPRKRRRRLKRLNERRLRIVRRLTVIKDLCRNKIKPEWITLSHLPVLPPALRPIIELDDGQLAVSDLNTFYQKVFLRNQRCLEDESEGKCKTYYQRLLQESVDALIENGKGNRPVSTPKGRPLKSFSDILKGKKGRFRQNLLGKRVDYSGRSVIVVGPTLKLHECGLPLEMALVLFQPFLIRQLIVTRVVFTIVKAKRLLQKFSQSFSKTSNKFSLVESTFNSAQLENFSTSSFSLASQLKILEILQQVMRNHPILLNRAPTLHRLGVQAFQPKLVDGKAILLHPLVCPAFNADFDGDQMAVHLPLSLKGRAEAWKIMWSRNNLLSPATGQPILVPSQDMVLGCYYLTALKNKSLDYQKTNFRLPQNKTGSKSKHRAKQVLSKNTCKAYQPQALPAKQRLSDTNSLDVTKQLSQPKLNLALQVKTGTKEPYLAFYDFCFTGFNDVSKAYYQNKLQLHTPVWVRVSESANHESEKGLEEPLEVRISLFGNYDLLFPTYQCSYNKTKQISSLYIRTTPGRIILNNVISAISSTKPTSFSKFDEPHPN